MFPRRGCLIASLLCVALSVPTWAMAARPFEIEVRGGLALAKLRNVDDPLNVFETLRSFTAGAGIAWGMGGAFEVGAEALYVEKGISFGESEGTDEAGNSTGTFTTLRVNKVIEVPVLVRWSILPGGVVKPKLFAGPFVSFEVAEQLKTTGSTKASVDDSILEDTDYGVVVGGGLQMSAGAVTWVVDARYDLGLADLGSFYASDSVHSGALALTAGVRF